jgi:hypothetical protein
LTFQEILLILETKQKTIDGVNVMKKKVGTLIEEEVIKLAKYRALEEGRPLSDMIQDALITYLNNRMSDPKKRERAYQLFCERPMRLSQKQFREILEEDSWDS